MGEAEGGAFPKGAASIANLEEFHKLVDREFAITIPLDHLWDELLSICQLWGKVTTPFHAHTYLFREAVPFETSH